MRPILPITVAALLAVAGCGETPPPKPIAAPPVAFKPVPGLERIIGKPATTATGLLGVPGLDRHDGPGRSLQFAAAGCILDVYYYPDPAAGQPTARYAEARLPNGKPDTTARCFAAQIAAKGHG
ncbi:hypothetical protein KZX46_05735 [Polymorphobacter sp. PAMC 29334]|uniref:hypothetical protein n=1 Tax=Polymorphobacter sp. PAMC 29334 TaxID=2862331 RepID=UPI001C771DF7|nr:hypothetical protein [Polymorphobacter sp. PAMC 29334]QYE35476.1 hypothetical protein KZX46_05735 [Polymorphobacter sp. PAMC 29334]